jgi:hypothetical protein
MPLKISFVMTAGISGERAHKALNAQQAAQDVLKAA